MVKKNIKKENSRKKESQEGRKETI